MKLLNFFLQFFFPPLSPSCLSSLAFFFPSLLPLSSSFSFCLVLYFFSFPLPLFLFPLPSYCSLSLFLLLSCSSLFVFILVFLLLWSRLCCYQFSTSGMTTFSSCLLWRFSISEACYPFVWTSRASALSSVSMS